MLGLALSAMETFGMGTGDWNMAFTEEFDAVEDEEEGRGIACAVAIGADVEAAKPAAIADGGARRAAACCASCCC